MLFKNNNKKPVQLNDLIGGLVRALIQAQKATTATTMEHIHTFTEKDEKTGALKPKFFSFKDNNDEQYKVPLLNIIPFPHMDISEAEIDMDLSMVDHQEQDIDLKEDDQKWYGLSKKKMNLFSVYKDIDKLDQKIHIKIKINQRPLPVGLQKYIDSMLSYTNDNSDKK